MVLSFKLFCTCNRSFLLLKNESWQFFVSLITFLDKFDFILSLWVLTWAARWLLVHIERAAFVCKVKRSVLKGNLLKEATAVIGVILNPASFNLTHKLLLIAIWYP